MVGFSTTPIKERIAKRVRSINGCWELDGYVHKNGYTQMNYMGKRYMAHRLSYTIFVGEIPEGLVIDHLCRNRACINPAHLEPVTTLENLLRQPNSNTFKTHCKAGHEYTARNTYLKKAKLSGRKDMRVCKTCTAIRQGREARYV